MKHQTAKDLAELFRALDMEDAALDVESRAEPDPRIAENARIAAAEQEMLREYKEAQKAAAKREQRGDCVVLRPSVWNARPQKKGARQGSKFNGSALKTEAAPAQSKKGVPRGSKLRLSRSNP